MGRPKVATGLTDQILFEALEVGATQQQIARQWQVSQATISRRVKNLKQQQIESSEPKPPEKIYHTTSGASGTESFHVANVETSDAAKSL